MLRGQGAWALVFCRDQQHKSINRTSVCLFPASHLRIADESIFSRIRSNDKSEWPSPIEQCFIFQNYDITNFDIGRWSLPFGSGLQTLKTMGPPLTPEVCRNSLH